MSIFRNRRKALLALAAAAIVVAALAAAAWFFHRPTTINEARVRADMITIRSEFAGQLTSVTVGTADRTQPEQVLATLDHRQADADVLSAAAKVEGCREEVDRLLRQLESAPTQKKIGFPIAGHDIQGARSSLHTAKTALGEANRRYRRGDELIQHQLLSTDQVESPRSQLAASQAELQLAQDRLATARLKARNTTEELNAADLVEQQIRAARASLADAEAGLLLARLRREKHDIHSPEPLIINRTFASRGDFVQTGQRLMMAHNPSSVRIEANVRESQLRRIAQGAEARVVLDAFPDRSLKGVVTRVGSAAMSEFSVLPTDNQTTYVRVAQRVPIEISVDWQGTPPAPGLLARVYITRP